METCLFLKDTFEYNYHCNNQLIDLFENQKQLLPEKSILLLNHLMNAQEIWNNRILETKSAVGVWEIRPLDHLKKINEINHNLSLHILETIPLDRTIEYTNSKGIAFSNSVQDILFHVMNHSTYHRAQIASDLKANGIEPLNSDYIFYKRK